MIIMYSDYNPDHAAQNLEEDSLDMLNAGLFIAGMDSDWISQYNLIVNQSADAYESQLGATDGRLEQDYKDAIEAAAPYQEALHIMLGKAGITLVNTLMKPPRKDHHHFIQTKIYSEGANCHLAACINRPITDLEAKTYTNNITGFGSNHSEWPINYAAGKKRKDG